MNQITKYTKTLAVIGIVATIIGYLALLYKGYTLNADVKYQEKRRDSLKIVNNELEKIVELNKIKAREQDSIIFKIAKDPTNTQSESELGDKLIEKLGISDKNFVVTSKENTSIENARKFEEEGFQFLINKDVNAAISAFTKSENSYNSYHQVYEIAKYLRKNRKKLSDKKLFFWKTAYTTILTEYSYKMPQQYKLKMENLIKE